MEFLPTLRVDQYLCDSTPKKNERVARCIDYVLESLGELQNSELGFLIRDKIKLLSKELKFLLALLGDAPFQCTEVEENKNILIAEIENVANKAGNFVYSFFSTGVQVTLTQMDLSISVLLPNFENLKAKIKDHYIAISKQLSLTTPKTGVISLSIVDSLLSDLEDFMNHKADLIVEVKDPITTLHKEMKLSRSFLSDKKVQQHSELRELIESVMQLRDLAYEAEYIITWFVAGEVPSWYLSLRLFDFIHKNELINIAIRKIELNYEIESLRVAEIPSEVSSQSESISMANEIVVGFELERKKIIDQLIRGPDSLQIISITGMPGLGKTTLAKKLYDDPFVVNRFDKRSWCVVSQTYQKRKLLIDILSSISDSNRDTILEMDDECLATNLYQTLKGRRYTVFMDDIWDIKAWDDLKRYFPNDTNGSRVLFTSRNKDVVSQASSEGNINELQLLTENECWDLFQKKVFQEGCCPTELEAIGKQMVEDCHGLPLSVVVVAAVLANMEMDEIVWREFARSLRSHISENSNKQILELSYKHLPVHLQPCFLYFGAFEEDSEIPVKKLLSLWMAEGFIQKNEKKSPEDVAQEYLIHLINRSLVQVAKKKSDGGVQACIVHDLIRDMCLRIAKEEKFLKVIKRHFSIHEQHHHICVNPYAIYDWTRPFGLHIRSLLSYPHPCGSFTFQNMKLTRVLELLHKDMDPRPIEFPVHLRYLAIPLLVSSIGKLENLEFLFLTRTDEIPPVLLQMPKLRHLHVQTPAKFSKNCDSSQKNNLETLSVIFIFDLNDEEILRCSPNLSSLKCICQPFWVVSGGYRTPDLHFLTRLESLKMEFKSTFRGNYSMINFPLGIKKLTLSKTGLPWEEISVIGTLPKLEVLKLESDAFVGESWNTNEDEFQILKFLKLDNLRLEQWNSSSDHFPALERLVLQECYQLRQFPSELGYISTLQTIEVRSCGTDVRNLAMEVKEELFDSGYELPKVIISG